jgi:hypothetical protein
VAFTRKKQVELPVCRLLSPVYFATSPKQPDMKMPFRKNILLLLLLLSVSGFQLCLAQQPAGKMGENSYGDSLAKRDHFIDKRSAFVMIKRYMDNMEKLAKGGFAEQQNVLPIAEAFNKAIMAELLAVPNAVGIRYYHGMTDKFEIKLIAFPVDRKGGLLFLKRAPVLTNPTDRGGMIDGAAEMTQKDPPMIGDGRKVREMLMNQLRQYLPNF